MAKKVMKQSGEAIPAVGDKPLSPREERFCREYVIDRNGSKAYRRDGWTPRTDQAARTGASTLLTKPNIKGRIAELEQALAEDAKLRAHEVYEEIALLRAHQVYEEIALMSRSSVCDYRVDAKGKLTLKRGVPANALRAVSSVETTVTQQPGGRKQVKVKYRLWNKTAAVRMAGKALGIFRAEAIPFTNCSILIVSGFDPDLVLGRRLVNQEQPDALPAPVAEEL
jgi:phage terminase small subunit